MRSRISYFLIVFSVSLFACAHDNTVDGFQGAVDQPVDYYDGDYCVAGNDGHYQEYLNVESGSRQEGGYWAEAGGCIMRPLREVWAVAHNQPLFVWDRVDEYNVTERLAPQNTTHFYEIFYKVKEIITVSWTMEWYHSLRAGTTQNPGEVLINFQKVSGTRYIPFWKGSVILKEIAPGVTEFSMLWLIDANQQSEEKAAESVRTMYEKFRTGVPNWDPLNRS